MDQSGHLYISFSPKDKDTVLPEIRKREQDGAEIWYDTGINGGEDWEETIGNKIKTAASVLYFKSKNAEHHDRCLRELEYAYEHGIPVETVDLQTDSGYRTKRERKRLVWLFAGLFVVAVAAALFAAFAVVVPDVVGAEIADAEEKLQSSGIEYQLGYVYSSEDPLGTVKEQSRSGLCFGHQTVQVTGSLGSSFNLERMPDVIGADIGEAVRKLAGAGFDHVTIIPGPLESYPFASVLSQSAPGGYSISKDNTIIIRIAAENTVQFQYGGYVFEIEGADPVTIDFSHPENYGISYEEWKARTAE